MNKLLVTFFSLLIISGCDNSNKVEELRKKIEEKKLTTVINVPKPPELKQFEVYNYKSGSLKSPFKNAVSTYRTEAKIFSEIKPDDKREKESLENYDLISIRMTGTIKKEGEKIQAVLETDDGRVYIVDKNNYIGKNNGQIKEIFSNKVVIEEVVSNGSYRWQKRAATISMYNNGNKVN